jgi:alkylation response protein AidB-like acyl-CoA dehydrogenase
VTSTLDAVRALAPLVRDHEDTIEQERCLPKPVIRGLVEAGVFQMFVPRSLGGDEIDPLTACRVVEEASTQDGAVGWCAMIGACNGYFGGLLSVAARREIFADRTVVLAGTFRPTGVAVVTDGGYRVTGRWPFASGIMHSDWLFGGCSVHDAAGPRRAPSGAPVTKLIFVPRGDARVLDTWHTGGLRGTGSHDFEVTDVFVPAGRCVWFSDPPEERTPLYSFPTITFLSTVIASVPLGIARHALELFKGLAGVKKPTGSQDLLRANGVTQSQLGEAEGLLRAGRAFLLETVAEAWEVVSRGEPLSWHQRALLWLAATQAATQAAQAVDIVYRAGGGSSVYASAKLERCFRDIHTASQHFNVAYSNYQAVGQFFLGDDMRATFWNRDNRGDAF